MRAVSVVAVRVESSPAVLLCGALTASSLPIDSCVSPCCCWVGPLSLCSCDGVVLCCCFLLCCEGKGREGMK